jgi:hypothetical protein
MLGEDKKWGCKKVVRLLIYSQQRRAYDAIARLREFYKELLSGRRGIEAGHFFDKFCILIQKELKSSLVCPRSGSIWLDSSI